MAAKPRRKRIPGADTPSGLVLTDRDEAVTDWPTIRTWVLNRDAHICQICFMQAATDVDHIWPRRLGGTDHVDNLRAACGPCNKSKGDRVDIDSASRSQLLRATWALSEKIAELEAEQASFEYALLALASSDTDDEFERVLASSGRALVQRSERLRASGERRLKASERIEAMRALFESAPDAEVIPFPSQDPGPDEAA